MKRCPNGTRRNKNTGLCEKQCPKGSRKINGLCKKYKKSPKSPAESPPKSPAESPPKSPPESPKSPPESPPKSPPESPPKSLSPLFIKTVTSENNIVIKYKYPSTSNKKLAIFDVDWTLIKPKEGRKFPKNVDDWQWLRASVPETVKKYNNEDYNVVFLTDQSKPWKVHMIENVILVLDIPITCLIAMNKEYHKPNPAFFMENYKSKYNKDTSFYVGDAAGREGDWSSNDINVSKNIGIRFHTPEEIFDLKVQAENVNNLALKSKEVIIMVGYPASGKSTVAKELEKHNYIRIDGDTLKTGPKMVKEAEKHINNNSVIFDATNGTKERRQYYLDFANKHNVNVRCLWKTTPIEQAMEQNRERQKQGGPKIPDIVFYTYRKKFEEPTESECAVVKI